MPGWIGPWELAILLVIVLLVFGPKRLPEMGRSLGRGMREFKNSITSDHHDADERPALQSGDAGQSGHASASETVTVSSRDSDT
jgi:sec-independent protein translocase protein TatA